MPVTAIPGTPASQGANAPHPTTSRPTTKSLAIQLATDQYLDQLKSPYDCNRIAADLVDVANHRIAELNRAAKVNGQDRIGSLQDPSVPQIATALIRLHHVVRLSEDAVSSDHAQLATYIPSGDQQGIYSTDEREIRRLAKLYTHLTPGMLLDLMQTLRDAAPSVSVCDDPDLIGVKNGIFDYRTKELRPFTPDIVLLSKSPVDFVQNPPAPVLHHADGTSWTLDSWLDEVATVPDQTGCPVVDTEVVNALWQLAGAVVRPLVRWNKAAFLYSTTGNNGKGTYAEFLRALTGRSANIPLADLGKEFHLEGLANTSAIIADENDVGVFLDKVGNLKALITQDVILVNRKNKIPIGMRWRGLMVQCLNALPESRDKSQSFYRRQLFVPFRNRFEGVERKYIKADYLRRREVLEYALHRVLTMPAYYELQTPSAGRHLMAEYQLANDNTREFWSEIGAELVWDIVPNAFLHDLYTAWMARVNPSGRPQGRNTFLRAIREIVSEEGLWLMEMDTTAGKPKVLRVGTAMDAAEPLIDTYNLTAWMAKGYTGNNASIRCTTTPLGRVRGISRRTSGTAAPRPATP